MYKIGDIIYVILNEENRVLPMLIVEELIRSTIDGKTTSYVVQISKDKAATSLLSDIKGEIFSSAEEVRTELMAKVNHNIQKLIASAEQKAKEWYMSDQSNTQNTKIHYIDSQEDSDEDEDVYVILSDGTKAKVKNKDMLVQS